MGVFDDAALPVAAPCPPADSTLEAIPLPGVFDLELTLNCGQVFHWQRNGDGYVGTVGSTPVYVEQRGEVLWATTGRAAILARYFALDHPMEEIYATLPRDPAMDAALAACRGLRIIRQPLWECLATFITSALKQVAHIAQISHTLRRRFGQPAGEIGGVMLFAYPTIEEVARLQEAELRACGMGFRAVSLLTTAQRLAAAEQGGERLLEDWRAMHRADALTALTGLRGVGTKVANCVLLFGYEHLDAFPIDVWIERVLRDSYFQAEPEAPLIALQRFAERHFGPYGGYAQQYLFHQARIAGRKTPKPGAAASRDEREAPIRRVKGRAR